MEQLKSFFSGKSIQNILDIGTGSGDFIKLISPVFQPETQITGIDPSEEALAEARRLNELDNVEFVRMEGESLSFEDNSFDVVCLSNAMHHLASTTETFAEMKRVVKPEGWILIAEIVSDNLNEAQETQKMVHHFKSYVDRKSGITHHETWTEAEVLDIIRESGIKPLYTFPYNRMADPVFEPENQEKWITMFSSHLALLQGQPEHEEKAILFDEFKERLGKFGFQFARQIVVIGQVG